jgi:hypothetical protein
MRPPEASHGAWNVPHGSHGTGQAYGNTSHEGRHIHTYTVQYKYIKAIIREEELHQHETNVLRDVLRFAVDLVLCNMLHFYF